MCVKRGQPPFHPSLAEAGHQIREALPARERGLAPFHSPSGLARRSRAIDAKARFASRLTRLTRLVGLMCGNFCTDASDRYLGCPPVLQIPFRLGRWHPTSSDTESAAGKLHARGNFSG